MNSFSVSSLRAALLFISLSGLAMAEERPVTGKGHASEPVDTAICEFMDMIGCRAAVIAISKDGKLLYSRGYGWSDDAREKPVEPDALMRIASVTKPITAAAIKKVFRAKKISFDTKAFEIIAVKRPGDKVADPRINRITVAQLLEHKGGWNRETTYDPMFETKRIEKELGLSIPASPVNVIEYMLTQPLQSAPGEKTAYSNFGYCVLGRVLEKLTKTSYPDCIQQTICKPLSIKNIKIGHAAVDERDAREVWYPVTADAFAFDVMDSHGGLIASAPALCQFLDAYWISGERRLKGERQNWTFFGSLPGTTAMVRQREDGINIAVLLNGRRDTRYNEDNDSLHDAIEKAVERIQKRK